MFSFFFMKDFLVKFATLMRMRLMQRHFILHQIKPSCIYGRRDTCAFPLTLVLFLLSHASSLLKPLRVLAAEGDLWVAEGPLFPRKERARRRTGLPTVEGLALQLEATRQKLYTLRTYGSLEMVFWRIRASLMMHGILKSHDSHEMNHRWYNVVEWYSGNWRYK